MRQHLLLGCSDGADAGGGIVSYVRGLALELSQAGHRVSIVSPRSAGAGWRCYGAKTWLDSGLYSNPRDSMQEILSFIVRERVTGVINNDHPFVQAIAPLSPIPVLSVIHGQIRTVPVLALWNHEAVDYLVCISTDMARMVRQRLSIDENRTPIVYNGVARSLLKPYRTVRATGKLRAAFLGGWDRGKGADLVAKLARSTMPDADRIEIMWAGGVPPRARRRLEAMGHVKILGNLPYPDALDVLREADVLLFASRREGCPMALLEGMALGAVPIVAEGEGAMREIVVHCVNGFLFKRRDWVRQAMACLRTPVDAVVWEQFRNVAYRHVMQRFHVEHTAATLLDLLARPRVERGNTTAKALQVIDWHRRPAIGLVAGMPARLRYRLGLLKPLGVAQFTASA